MKYTKKKAMAGHYIFELDDTSSEEAKIGGDFKNIKISKIKYF
jgi:hypothetical protein